MTHEAVLCAGYVVMQWCRLCGTVICVGAQAHVGWVRVLTLRGLRGGRGLFIAVYNRISFSRLLFRIASHLSGVVCYIIVYGQISE